MVLYFVQSAMLGMIFNIKNALLSNKKKVPLEINKKWYLIKLLLL